MAEVKRVTLHPVRADGSMDTNINLYPKTLIDGIVDRQERSVEVQEKLIAGENIVIDGNRISATGGSEPIDAYTKEESDARFVSKEQGKGLSQNDYTNEDKMIVDNVSDSIKVYEYLLSDDGEVVLDSQPTKFFLNAISTRGIYDSLAVIDFEPEQLNFYIEDAQGDYYLNPIFANRSDLVKLYKTGSNDELRTERYAYDSIDLDSEKVIRYCKTIPLGDFIVNGTDESSQKPTWQKASGTWRMRHSEISNIWGPNSEAVDKIVATNNWKLINITENDELSVVELSASGLNSTYLDFTGFLQFDEVWPEDKPSSYSTYSTFKQWAERHQSDLNKFLIVFKRVQYIEEPFSAYDLEIVNKSQVCNEGDNVKIYNGDTLWYAVKVSYQSLKDYVYSKEQTDEKFQLKEGFYTPVRISEETIEASSDIYDTLANLGYPKLAICKFSASTSEIPTEKRVPFLGDTLFINQNRGTSEQSDNGYVVISNGQTYWFAVRYGNVTLETLNGFDVEWISWKDTSDFSGEDDPLVKTKLPPRNVDSSDFDDGETASEYIVAWSNLIKKIIKRGYIVTLDKSICTISTTDYQNDVNSVRIAYLENNNLIRLGTDTEDVDYTFNSTDITTGGSGSGGALYQHTIRIYAWDDTVSGGMNYDDVIFKIITSSPTPFTLATFKQQCNLLPLEGATVLKYFSGGEDSSYYGGMIRECSINSVNQNIEMTIDMYNYDEITPSINASWTTLGDDVIQL